MTMRWLMDARRAANAPPLQPRLPLRAAQAPLGDSVLIGSIEVSLAERLGAATSRLERQDDGWRVLGPIDEAFAVMARWLHDEGIVTRWRGELLAVTDPSGNVLGAVERSAVRAFGLTSFAVHLVGTTTDGRYWVQQRAKDKATDPGRWDTLMGGQIAAGETTESALERETMEEAGLAIADLQGLERRDRVSVRRPVPEGYMVEHIEVFRAVVLDGVEPVNRDGEVERFECLPADALLERLRAGAFTLEAALILGAELESRGGLAGAASTQTEAR